jgi:hypothetical protein
MEGKPKPKSAGTVSLAAAQNTYSMQVLSLIHVAREIRKGRAEELASSIEASLATHLRRMSEFPEAPVTTAAFYTAGLLYRATETKTPAGLATPISTAGTKIKQAVSEECFELLDVCACGAGCVPWPTSLRPVNVNKQSEVGWHYIVNSHCGFSWPKFWRLDCCQPIGIVQCETFA